MVRQLVDVMARDLGVPRIPGDDAEGHAFTTRTVFTALRFWVQACCIDDGYGGAMGIAPAATEQKALDWIARLSAVYPWLTDMFTATMIHRYCLALVSIGDLVHTADGTLRCTKPHDAVMRVKGGAPLTVQLGLRDLSAQDWKGCVLSGALVFAGVGERKGMAGFEPGAIDPRLPYRDELLFLAMWPNNRNYRWR